MRTLFIVTVFLCTGLMSYARDNGSGKQMNTSEKGSALTPIFLSLQSNKELGNAYKSRRPKNNDAVSIYKFKNTKIKKALAFTTKGHRPKLA
ncbi:hypothetical protein [Maribacter arenosus]|uniref:Uncharacterized protein n=1 Tax=Maribacter arenosus TaxID=1854708 RepID=A0ABR7VBM8_9FLAO|nr:hypothetical protein [Maribacter arenosus]MBD0851059.1 hypothetical protein [Maribacter arenosus]